MSVYDFSPFKNSPLSEPITYTSVGQAAKTIDAVVFRNQSKTVSGKSDVPVIYFPIVVEVDRTDIALVTENEDIITCPDITGESKSFRVRKIIYSDPGCFKLGL